MPTSNQDPKVQNPVVSSQVSGVASVNQDDLGLDTLFDADVSASPNVELDSIQPEAPKEEEPRILSESSASQDLWGLLDDVAPDTSLEGGFSLDLPEEYEKVEVESQTSSASSPSASDQKKEGSIAWEEENPTFTAPSINDIKILSPEDLKNGAFSSSTASNEESQQSSPSANFQTTLENGDIFTPNSELDQVDLNPSENLAEIAKFQESEPSDTIPNHFSGQQPIANDLEVENMSEVEELSADQASFSEEAPLEEPTAIAADSMELLLDDTPLQDLQSYEKAQLNSSDSTMEQQTDEDLLVLKNEELEESMRENEDPKAESLIDENIDNEVKIENNELESELITQEIESQPQPVSESLLENDNSIDEDRLINQDDLMSKEEFVSLSSESLESWSSSAFSLDLEEDASDLSSALPNDQSEYQSEKEAYISNTEAINDDTSLQENSPQSSVISSEASREGLPSATEEIQLENTPSEASSSPHKLLSLDEMISQFSQKPEAVKNSSPVAEKTEESVAISSHSEFQNNNQEASSPAQVNQAPQSLDTMIAQVGSVNLTSPKLATAPKNPMKKLIPVVWVLAIVVIVGFVAFLRYPDLFSWNLFTTPVVKSTEEPVLTWGVDDGEHFVAPELSGDQKELEDTELSGDIVPLPDIDWTETEITPTENSFDPTKVENASEGEITYIDLEAEADVEWEALVESKEEFDPLTEAEKLVWPVDNNEVIKEEILDYKRRAEELLELGSINNDRNMRKYWAYIKSVTEKMLDELASGVNISISEWRDQKKTFDGFLNTSPEWA